MYGIEFLPRGGLGRRAGSRMADGWWMRCAVPRSWDALGAPDVLRPGCLGRRRIAQPGRHPGRARLHASYSGEANKYRSCSCEWPWVARRRHAEWKSGRNAQGMVVSGRRPQTAAAGRGVRRSFRRLVSSLRTPADGSARSQAPPAANGTHRAPGVACVGSECARCSLFVADGLVWFGPRCSRAHPWRCFRSFRSCLTPSLALGPLPTFCAVDLLIL